ncbi:MAG: hypothetical protein WC489_06520 [Patescibacteria group bacterium]
MYKTYLKWLVISFIIVASSFIIHYLFSVFVVYGLPSYNHENGKIQHIEGSFVSRESPITHIQPLWQKWDSNHYLIIAKEGYERLKFENDRVHNWAFFPLYPLLVRWITKFTAILTGVIPEDVHFFRIGIILSNFFLVGAVYLLRDLIFMIKSLQEKNKNTIVDIVLLFIVFPTGYFFHMFYTESLYLFLTMLFFVFLFRHYYRSAAFVVSLLLVTKFIALSFIPVYFYHYYYEGRKTTHSNIFFMNGFINFGIIISPILVFFTHLYSITGNFFAAVDIQKAWAKAPPFFLSSIVHYVASLPYTIIHWPDMILNVICALVLLLLCLFFLWKVISRKGKTSNPKTYIIAESFLIYLWFYVLIVLSSGSLVSVFRYANVNIALFLLPFLLWWDFVTPKVRFLMYCMFALHFLFFSYYLLQSPIFYSY